MAKNTKTRFFLYVKTGLISKVAIFLNGKKNGSDTGYRFIISKFINYYLNVSLFVLILVCLLLVTI